MRDNDPDSNDYERQLERSLYEPSPELLAINHRFIGAAIEVHRHLGPGYTEIMYRRAMCVELAARGMSYATEVPVDIVYKGELLGSYRLDFIVEGILLIELKSIERITQVHVAQTVSYLKSLGLPFGLIVNFNVPLLHQGIRRVYSR